MESPPDEPILSHDLLEKLPDITRCETPLLKSLWALLASKLSKKHPDFISAEVVSLILLHADVNLPPVRVVKSLARAGDGIARFATYGSTRFRIVAKGETMLWNHASPVGPLAIRLTGKLPWSDRRFLAAEAAKKASGEIRIVDKYFGVETLDFLQYLQPSRRIRCLTARPSKGIEQIHREISLFRKQFPKAEFKAFAAPHELHDRYLIFDSELWFVGHGLKSLGEKESFIVLLEDPFGRDIRKTLSESFDARWSASHDL